MLYFAAATLPVDGGLMVTGSHNPPDHNGFKMVLRGKAFLARRSSGSRKWRRRSAFPTGRAAASSSIVSSTITSAGWRGITGPGVG